MKKRILSFFLTVALILSMVPVLSVPTKAASVFEDDLQVGGLIMKDTVVRKSGNYMYLHVIPKDTMTDIEKTTKRVSGETKITVSGSSWTADANYYVVYVAGLNDIFLYKMTTWQVTFNISGGTMPSGTSATFPVTTYQSDYCDVSWLSPTRPGCTFLGWYTSGGTKVYNANGLNAGDGTYWKDNTWRYKGNITLYAKWQANTSVTFRYFPNGGVGQPDNFEQWTANATYFDTYPSDSHWNYTSGTYKLTRVGYVATGNYAKKDGSCVVHEDDNFTSYPQLCAAYGLNPDTCGNATIDIYAQWAPLDYQVSFNGNGATGGSMANQAFTYDTPQALTPNAFERVHTLSFDVGGDPLPAERVVATFDGWQDRGSIVYDGVTYAYTDFDGQGYAARNPDVTNHTSYGNGIMNKYEMIRHYITYGKAEYEKGSATRAPITEQIYSYSDGQTVTNLSTTPGYTVPLYAKWKYGKTTLPTPTRTGYTFKGWTGDLMDIATLTNGMEISDISRGTIGYNANYAITENLIPVVGGATYTSNYSICGIYSYDANGNFIKRETDRATTHTVSPNAAFVRIELITTEGISFDQYKNGLTLTYTLPAGTAFPVGGNQTLTATWTPATYTITFDAQGGTTSLKSLPVVYGSNQNNKIDVATNPTKTDYTFLGWFTQPQGGEQVYKTSNGSCYAGEYWSNTWETAGTGAVWQHPGNVTLYAHWAYTGTCVITFDAQGGTTSLTSLPVVYGSNQNNRIDVTTNPTKEGYTFDGWFDAPEGGSRVYKSSNGSCYAGDYWTNAWEIAGTGATWKGPKTLTLYAHWIPKKYTVTWKNYDGSVLETDTGVVHGTTPTYNGATPTKPEDENFTYTFNGWSPAISAVTGDAEYIAQFTAVSKRVEPTYTVTIPAAVNEGESFKVSATSVVLNTDQTLTVTLQSDFKLRNEQGAQLAFKIHDGTNEIGNGTEVLSITGNGDKNTPLAKDSEVLRIQVAEEAKYAGTYTGSITFTIAVNTAENN